MSATSSIKWFENDTHKLYPYNLKDCFYAIECHNEYITLCELKVEHPKEWNKEKGEWDIDFNKKLILVSSDFLMIDTKSFKYERKDKALAYCKLIIEESKEKILSALNNDIEKLHSDFENMIS